MPFGRSAIFAARCPDELWTADNPVIRRASPLSLAVFCQRSSRAVTIGRNGVKDPDLDAQYWAEEFIELKGRRVYLRRDLHNFAEAFVYDAADDKLLCLAKLAEAIHPLADDEISKAALKERMAEKRHERKAVAAKAKAAARIPGSKKQELIRAGVAALNAERGWSEPASNNLIEIQHTPLDERARQIEQLRREATTDTPVYPVLPPQPKRKIYLTRTAMELDKH